MMAKAWIFILSALLVATILTDGTYAAENRCGNGWDQYDDTTCFLFVRSGKTRDDAVKACRAMGEGVDLASVHSQKEMDFIKSKRYSFSGNYLYTGLKDESESKQSGMRAVRDWKWSDGTSVDYTNWVRNDPNNYRGIEWCVVIVNYQSYRWYDTRCDEAHSYLCKKVLPPPITCGRLGAKQEKERVVGGKDSSAHKHPWAVFFKIQHNLGGSRCSGTLIHSEWVVSTAQCFVTGLKIYGMEYNLQKVEVTLGKDDISKDEDGSQTMDVPLDNIHRHADFLDGQKHNLQNNIVLIKLPKPVKYTDSIQPICLPQYSEDSKLFDKKDLTLVGWGAKENGVKANVLQEATANIIDLEECKKNFPDLKDNVICLKNDAASMCMGDGGGTVEFQSEVGATFVGMNAFSKMEFDGTCKTGNAGGAMFIPSFIKWISETTGLPVA